MAKKKSAPSATRVEAIRHDKETRPNIPTKELSDFIADEEKAPKAMLYPRNPDLDPQLVWKGKDEQDREDLAVPVVPVYIQETIEPRTLINDLIALKGGERAEEQMSFFADLDRKKEFTDRVDFYHHDHHWSNRMILGDSLLVMTSLAEKERLKEKVQTIYLDPPYGIKFGSNWQISTRRKDVKDGKVSDVTRQPEQIRAFRDTWNLGISSYLSYLRDRLIVANELLASTGSIFIQIGVENVHLVRSVLDETFGATNFISQIAFGKTSGATDETLPSVCDYLIWYGKDRTQTKFNRLFLTKGFEGFLPTVYRRIELSDGSRRSATKEELEGQLPNGARIYSLGDLTSSRVREARTGYFPITHDSRSFLPGSREWSTHREGIERLRIAKRIEATENRIGYVRYLDDFPALKLGNMWTDTSSSFMADKVYVVQTTQRVIERCLLMTTDPGDLVLDPTCGSGTTAYVAEQWGRRWITIDTSRVALALARTRLMAAKFPYYHLADSSEGIKKETELSGKTPPPHPTEGDIRKGFVYKRVPHVTLKSIANNPDIKEGMTRVEIDRAIARHADQETLFDQPYEDKSRIRVTGPFTVESLSPHRVLPTDDDRPVSEAVAVRNSSRDFASMILDNLRKSGVQNTVKGERLKFDRLDAYPGSWLQATGEYTESDGKPKRVAVSIGPEFGTVGKDHLKEAAKEAVQGLGHDLLVVCAFAFDAEVAEEAKKYGRLPVLITRMNPDLAMGDELLKKTGAGNLFMVFGEPDLRVDKTKEGEHTVEVFGVDVYDPTTGVIRNSSTDDIACWFIDTEYDGESFFVRHAYFCGADEPYEKLKRALRAEVDEEAWSSLNSTKSRPFPRPKSGKIAVKVINHYGDEVLKVLPV